MAVTEFLARGCTFELNNGSIGSPDWVAVGHMNNWSHSPQANDADTTTYDDDGRMSHMKASRGDEFTFSGLNQEDPDNGDRDAGQVACEAWADLIGPQSRKQFRITTPGGNTMTFEATATITRGGGGNDDPNAWELAIKVTGAITNSDRAAAPDAPTSPDATTGNDLITGTWVAPAGTIEAYEVQVYEDAGDTVVKTVLVGGNTLGVYVTGLTTATAYYFKVRARTSGGWGPYSVASDTVTTS